MEPTKVSFTKGYNDRAESKLEPYVARGRGIRCPDYEICEDFYHGRLNFEDFVRMLFHISKCSNCAETIAIAKNAEGIEPPKKLPPRLDALFEGNRK